MKKSKNINPLPFLSRFHHSFPSSLKRKVVAFASFASLGLLFPSVAFAHDPGGWARSGHLGLMTGMLATIIIPLAMSFLSKMTWTMRCAIIVAPPLVAGVIMAWQGLFPMPSLDPAKYGELRLGDLFSIFFVMGFLVPVVILCLVLIIIFLTRFIYRNIRKKPAETSCTRRT